MKRSTKNQVAGLLIFLAFGVMAFGGLFFLVGHPPTDAGQLASLEAGVIGEDGAGVEWEPGTKVVLMKNRPTRVGSSLLVYRGLEAAGAVRIDLTIPALDPERVYSVRILLDERGKPFTMAQQRYKLLSAGRSAVRLRMEG